MIIIESKNTQKPSINDYIKYLLFWAKYNIDNVDLNKLTIIQHYNPINGKIFEWDMTDYSLSNNNSYSNICEYFLQLSNSKNKPN
jgi:hypothetical protein